LNNGLSTTCGGAGARWSLAWSPGVPALRKMRMENLVLLCYKVDTSSLIDLAGEIVG
jgi:hypothetical protein